MNLSLSTFSNFGLQEWSWFFMIVYIGGMVFLSYVGARRVNSADGFATARQSYGPFILALAFSSTAASGGTFLGLPGLAYSYGFSTLWIAFIYPLGIYFGVMVCQKMIGDYGNRVGARSIPDFLGDRYQSEVLRIVSAIFSLILLFYLAGQLIAGIVMFEMMLGLGPLWGLLVTMIVLMLYVTFGGAHADILTDGVQGGLMLLLAVVIGGLFFFYDTGIGSGLAAVVNRLEGLDPTLVDSLNPNSPLTDSVWAMIAVFVTHVTLGLMPHNGNKLWALKDSNDRNRFLRMAFVMGMTLPLITLGGLMARAVLGDQLLAEGFTPNAALPTLFVEIFPAWLAALLGVGVLAAVMSTADGIVVSTSQVFANDIYRRVLVPRFQRNTAVEKVERNALWISRLGTIGTVITAGALGWVMLDMPIAIVVSTGIGGMAAALSGPLVLGALWRGVTGTAALVGFVSGVVTFILLNAEIISGTILFGTQFDGIGRWLVWQAKNPYSCATIGSTVSILLTYITSLYTVALPEEHVNSVFNPLQQSPTENGVSSACKVL